jgi:hypothetical protein
VLVITPARPQTKKNLLDIIGGEPLLRGNLAAVTGPFSRLAREVQRADNSYSAHVVMRMIYDRRATVKLQVQNSD